MVPTTSQQQGGAQGKDGERWAAAERRAHGVAAPRREEETGAQEIRPGRQAAAAVAPARRAPAAGRASGQQQQDFKHEGESVNTEIRCTKGASSFAPVTQSSATTTRAAMLGTSRARSSRWNPTSASRPSARRSWVSKEPSRTAPKVATIIGSRQADQRAGVSRDYHRAAGAEPSAGLRDDRRHRLSPGCGVRAFRGPMTDIRLVQQGEYPAQTEVSVDWSLLSNGTLDDSEALATAVIVALGTDRLATRDDILPDPDSTDRRGWWGDLDTELIWNGWPIGTRLWLLKRDKIIGAGAQQARRSPASTATSARRSSRSSIGALPRAWTSRSSALAASASRPWSGFIAGRARGRSSLSGSLGRHHRKLSQTYLAFEGRWW